MKEFLTVEKITTPAEFKRNARRFLYYQLYRTSLPFGQFLEPSVRVTQTKLKSFELDELLNSASIKTILHGVLDGGDCLVERIEENITYQLIRNGTLIDGTGAAPVTDAAVLVKDNRIQAVGRANSIRLPDAQTTRSMPKAGSSCRA